MRRKKSVTLQHIADQVGVSKVTISKALNNKEGVSDELRLKIWEVAQEIGYKFSVAKEGERSKNVGIIIHEKYIMGGGPSTFYLKFYQELAIKLNQRGYICNLFTITHLEDEKNMLPPMLIEASLNGVIAVGNLSRSYIGILENLNIPVVFLDCYYSDRKMDCIGTDNYCSTYEITSYLIEQGHREIAFVGLPKATTSIQDRIMGYCRALIEADIEFKKEWIIPDRTLKNEVVQIQLPESMPTAFVCNCDDTAYRLVDLLKTEGYGVPEDVSVVGFDNDIYAELCHPPLTTVAVDRDAITSKAVETLIQKIDGYVDFKNQQKIFIAGNIIYRDSVKRIG